MGEKYVQIFLPQERVITAELAMTEDERSKGLMFRKAINEDQGMLFVFEEEGLYPFWMKNMSFSIDILWLDRQKRIVHIEHGVPPCPYDPCPSYSPRQPALYVLELKAGMVEALDLHVFDRLEFILSVFSPQTNDSHPSFQTSFLSINNVQIDEEENQPVSSFRSKNIILMIPKVTSILRLH